MLNFSPRRPPIRNQYTESRDRILYTYLNRRQLYRPPIRNQYTESWDRILHTYLNRRQFVLVPVGDTHYCSAIDLFHCLLISKLPPRLLSGPTTISPVSLSYFAVITTCIIINQIYYTSTNYLSLLPLQIIDAKPIDIDGTMPHQQLEKSTLRRVETVIMA